MSEDIETYDTDAWKIVVEWDSDDSNDSTILLDTKGPLTVGESLLLAGKIQQLLDGDE